MGKSSFPYYKRFMELYVADPSFRLAMEEHPEETLQEYQLPLDARMAVEACSREYGLAIEHTIDPQENPYLIAFSRHNQDVLARYDRRLTESVYRDPRVRTWSSQVLERIRMESRAIRQQQSIHYFPVFFELSDGCSVQCPFCGLSAPKWTADFRYTPEHAALWKEILQILLRYIGPVAGGGTCYYGTEPLDNPDYERFVFDFYEVFGYYPQTTTAIADRYPQRIRALAEAMGEEALRCAAFRFSIRSLGQLKRIHELYTAEELSEVKLLLNNPESLSHYSLSGKCHRLKDHLKKEKCNLRYTISCATGVIVNMVNQTIRFVEPEMPSETYPTGLHIWETISFTCASDFEAGVRYLFEKWVQPQLPRDRKLYLNPCSRWHEKETEVLFLGDAVGCKLKKDGCFEHAVQLVDRERITFEEVCSRLSITADRAVHLSKQFQYLYEKGYLRCL
jgi:radical SAM family RiPP maturation amino acid epimerase